MSPAHQNQDQNQDQPSFSTLRTQIISLATALYGTPSCPHKTFDVLPFSTQTPPHVPPRTAPRPSHGAALIYYTGPPHAPYTSWEMLSYADDAVSVLAGATQLLEDMQRGVGDVIRGLVKRGDWAVRHRTVPDLAIGENGHGHGEHGIGDADAQGEGYSNGLGEERWGQPLGNIDEGDEYGQRGRAVV